MKKLFLIILLVILPSISFAWYPERDACQLRYCNEYPQFKLIWYGPDGVHTWDRVCMLTSIDGNGTIWRFCVDGKQMVVIGTIAAEEIK